MDHVAGWPWQAWLAAAQIMALLFWKPLSRLGQWIVGARALDRSRIDKLEDLIDELRRALDKGRIRESAIATMAELLIFAIDHVDAPSPAVIALRARALEVLELAKAHLQQFNHGGD